jgi:hypothetical protein
MIGSSCWSCSWGSLLLPLLVLLLLLLLVPELLLWHLRLLPCAPFVLLCFL